tara:strand:+ start:3208 stop:3519 length:312 start_codon:yes stop_codon:yes gene_type:complete
MSDIIECPICKRGYQGLLRYPNAVCNECISLYPIYDRYGNIIEFFNNWSGNNIISYVTINGQKIKSDDTTCFINDIHCEAEEGRFGGIIINVIENRNKRRRNK